MLDLTTPVMVLVGPDGWRGVFCGHVEVNKPGRTLLVYTYPFDTVAQCHLYEVVGIAVGHGNVYCYTKTVRPGIAPCGDFTGLHGVVSAPVARRDNHRPGEVLSYGVQCLTEVVIEN